LRITLPYSRSRLATDPAARGALARRSAIEGFLHDLYRDVKAEAPRALCTYVNFSSDRLPRSPFSTSPASTSFCTTWDFRAYVAKLQHIAGNRAGAQRGQDGQHSRAKLPGAGFLDRTCARRSRMARRACASSFTDDWWRGSQITDWAFGSSMRAAIPSRRSRPFAGASAVPFAREEQASWPKASVVICAYTNGTIEDNLSRFSPPALPPL
jgi:hypothetical protein